MKIRFWLKQGDHILASNTTVLDDDFKDDQIEEEFTYWRDYEAIHARGGFYTAGWERVIT